MTKMPTAAPKKAINGIASTPVKKICLRATSHTTFLADPFKLKARRVVAVIIVKVFMLIYQFGVQGIAQGIARHIESINN